MNWATAWQLAGEICDIIGNTTIQQQEAIANLLDKRDNQTFSTFFQEWINKKDKETRNEHQIKTP